MKPRVSILVPVYNRESLITDTIRSALSQTITDIEVIVVDNASTDSTWDVCKMLAEHDKRLKIFRNEENIGPVRNWQRCVDLAQGEFCKILFSDDRIEAEYLESTLHFLQDPQVAFVFTTAFVGTDVHIGSSLYRFLGTTGSYDSKRFVTEVLVGGDAPCSPGCALFRTDDVRRNLLLTIPSPSISDFENHGAGPDLLLFLLTAMAYGKVGYVDEPLVFFRAHSGSISESSFRPYLLSCYRQARLWFADTFLVRRLVRLLAAREWKREIKEAGNKTSPVSVLSKYLFEVPRISMVDILYASAGTGLRREVLRRRFTYKVPASAWQDGSVSAGLHG